MASHTNITGMQWQVRAVNHLSLILFFVPEFFFFLRIYCSFLLLDTAVFDDNCSLFCFLSFDETRDGKFFVLKN